MTQELAAVASVGGIVLLLTAVVSLVASERAAGGRSLPPTLVAGLLFRHGLVAVLPSRAARGRRALGTGAARGTPLPLGHLRHRR